MNLEIWLMKRNGSTADEHTFEQAAHAQDEARELEDTVYHHSRGSFRDNVETHASSTMNDRSQRNAGPSDNAPATIGSFVMSM